MAFSHGSRAEILLDGFNASNFLQEVETSGEIDTPETSCLGTTAKTYVPGMHDASVNMSGFWDYNDLDDSTTFSYKIENLYRVQTQATYMPQGDTLGFPCYVFTGILTSNGVSTNASDIASVEVELQGCNGMAKGRILHSRVVEDADDEGDAMDLGAPSTRGMNANLHVTNVSGTATPTLEVTLQGTDDATNGPWVDLGSFAPRTGKGSEYLRVYGAVPRYVRAVWEMTGTDPEFEFHVAAYRAK